MEKSTQIFSKMFPRAGGIGLLLLALCLSSYVKSQSLTAYADLQNLWVQGEKNMQPLTEVLTDLESVFKVSFDYNHKLLEAKQVDRNKLQQKLKQKDTPTDKELEEILSSLLLPLHLSYEKFNEKSYLIYAEAEKYELKKIERKSILPSDHKSTALGGNSYNAYSSFPSANNLLTTAQEKTITGQVTDENGESLPGVNILVKNTTIGTVSDISGSYRLSVPDDAETLVFSSVGYVSEELSINGRSVIDLQMAPDIQTLGEIVVVGYGTQKKSDLTGSIASVKSEELKAIPIASVEQGMRGRVAGVQVIQGNASPGGASNVRIRGGNSVLGGNEPLYVIDGFPVYHSSSSSVNETQPSNALATINPNDIVSVEVLKDASATAIYGSRGANGVVIITTKRGQAGKSNVDFDMYYGVQQVSNKIDLFGAQDYMNIANEKAQNLGQTLPYPDASMYPDDTDWQDELFRSAPIQNYTLTFSGGNDQNRYSISGNYFNQDGIVMNSGFERASIRVNLDNQISSKFKLTTSITAGRTINNRARNSINYSNGVIYSALVAPPIAPVFNEDGSYYDVANVPTADPAWENPVALARGYTNTLTTDRILGNVNAEYELTPDLTLGVRLGIDYDNSITDLYRSRLIKTSPNGIAQVNYGSATNVLNENILTYRKTFGEIHNLNVTAGYTWQEEIGRGSGHSSSDFLLDIFGTDNLGAGEITSPNNSSKSKYNLLSWIGRVNYILQDKYLFTVTARADGSSRFGEGNKWGFFPSAALAWRLSEEDFIQNMGVFSDLKIRGSYGLTGNQEIGSYRSLARLSTETAIMGENQNPVVGFAPANMANQNLKWETTQQLDIGLDIGFFTQRLTLTADYYVKNTTDLLASVPLALSSGFSSILLNSGEIKNSGFEVSTQAVIAEGGEVDWTVSANLSTNKNEVIDLAVEGGEFLAGNLSSPTDFPINIIREGEPLSAFYGYMEDGLWATDQDETSIQPGAMAGDIRYMDLSGDGVINDDDKTILGNPYPDIIFGFSSRVAYKNFDLEVFFQGVEGVKVFNANKFSIGDSFVRNANQLTDVNDRWTPENQNSNAAYPRASNVSPLPSDRFFEDASYLRLQNLSLGYNLPVADMGINWLRSARIYVSGQNLLVFTQYTGFDPEVNSTGGNDLRRGVDVGAYPAAKNYLVGLKVGF